MRHPDRYHAQGHLEKAFGIVVPCEPGRWLDSGTAVGMKAAKEDCHDLRAPIIHPVGIGPMTPELVFDRADLRLVLYPGDRRLLMVTLDWRRDGKADFSPANYSTTFARMGYAQLSIKTRANDWFLNADTLAAETAMARLSATYDRVQILGFSMGGYGALRFASVLGARSVVVVSPQWSLHPDQAPFEQRYPTESARFDPALGDLSSRAVPELRGLILIDPFVAADLQHARQITALFPKLRILRLNFGGHPGFQIVRDAGKTWTLHQAAAALQPNPAQIIAAHRAGRRGSAGYWQRLAATARTRHPAWTAYALARADGIGVDVARESP